MRRMQNDYCRQIFNSLSPIPAYSPIFLTFYLTPVCLYIFLLRPKRDRRERNDLTEFFWAANLSFFRLYFSKPFEAYPVFLKNQSLIKCHRIQAFMYFSSCYFEIDTNTQNERVGTSSFQSTFQMLTRRDFALTYAQGLFQIRRQVDSTPESLF